MSGLAGDAYGLSAPPDAQAQKGAEIALAELEAFIAGVLSELTQETPAA
jgi:hypothetical protein